MPYSLTTPAADRGPATAAERSVRAALTGALRRARYEVLPLAGTAEQVEEHVSPERPVTVTASPRRGLEPTLTLAETLAHMGYQTVPHLAARLVRDEGHLREILHRTDEAGIAEVFVVAGDSERPVGDFTDSISLLSSMQRLRLAGWGQAVERVGITGYPEGHPLIGDAQLAEALGAKAPLATYVVSQMCFDPTAVSAWLTQLRREDVALPLYVGVPGVVAQRKLLAIAGRIGVGPSVRFLTRHRAVGLRMGRPGGYRPDRLVRQLAVDMARPERGVAGLHVYTMGDIASTERWRRRALQRLAAGKADDG
jgi:methylenetetrahydrofolate reductase (NADPH)